MSRCPKALFDGLGVSLGEGLDLPKQRPVRGASRIFAGEEVTGQMAADGTPHEALETS